MEIVNRESGMSESGIPWSVVGRPEDDEDEGRRNGGKNIEPTLGDRRAKNTFPSQHSTSNIEGEGRNQEVIKSGKP